MAASVTDKFNKVSNGSQALPTTLSADKNAGATTASLNAATGWDTTTGKHVRMYKTKVVNGQTVPDTTQLCYYKATLAGTTLSGITLIYSSTGSDQKFVIGDSVDLAPNTGWADDLLDGILVSHDQDGTLKAGSVDGTTIMVDGIVTDAKAAAGHLIKASGWTAGSGTWTYASSTTFTVPAADAANMSVGTKVWITQTTSKYFYVTGVSGTTVTVTGGSDYSVANAAITSPYFSNATTPYGFPQFFNYAGAATGFSSTTATIYRFRLDGNNVTLHFGVSGTSNGTGFTITAPITSKNTANMFWQTAIVVGSNNGSNLTTAGRAYLANNSTTITLGTAPNSDTWTGSNTKAAYGTLIYEI